MKVESVPLASVDSTIWDRWKELQQSNPNLFSPYFCPEFFQILRDVGRPAEVAVIEEDGAIVALLPFARGGFGIGRPAGFPLTDYQGAISGSDWVPDLPRIVELLRLRALDFTHLLVDQLPADRSAWTIGQSPIVDLSNGYDAWAAERKEKGSRLISQTERYQRKMEREVGEVRFVWNAASPQLLDQLIQWKKAQYERTEVTDLFERPWPRELLERLIAFESADFGCVACALFCDGQLASVDLSLRHRDTIHSWFPAYDIDVGKYSPGSILLLETAKAAEENGVTRLDLGKGPEAYKERFVSYGVPLARGTFMRSGAVRTFRKTWRISRDWLRASPVRPAVEPLIGAARRVKESLSMR